MVHSALRGTVERHNLRFIWDRHRYEAVGISQSPGPEPQWERTANLDPGFVSVGGYFNMPPGLYIDEPVDGPYSLTVYAECEPFRSPVRRIEAGP